MARPAACALFTTFFAHAASASLHFLNPPPSNTSSDVSSYLEYTKGDSVPVTWTSDDHSQTVSILLVQEDIYDLMYPEYVLVDVAGSAGFQWRVSTQRNLTESNLFSLTLYQGSDQLSPKIAHSQYFYIVEDAGRGMDLSLSSSATSPTATSSALSGAASNSASESTLRTTSMSTHYGTNHSTGMPTPTGSNLSNIETNGPNIPDENTTQDRFALGAKIGLGVGIPIAIILGLLAGWLLFRRRRRDSTVHELPASMTEQLGGRQGVPGVDLHEAAGAHVHEAPPNQRLEIGPSKEQRLTRWGGELDNDSTRGSIRHEMDAGSPVEDDSQAVESGK